MARRFRDRGSWHYGGAPAEGSTPHPSASSGDIGSAFVKGIDNATDDPIKQYLAPQLSGSTIRGDVSPGVWGQCAQRP